MTEDPRAAPVAGALNGVRVLDMTHVVAGPMCSMTLGDLGAEVIKIEHPELGDDTRRWSPFGVDGESAYFYFANRNKKSVALDFSHPDGLRLLHELALLSDVFVENFRPGVLARHQLDYAALKAINPRLIYCTISGYGVASSLAGRPGYDFIAQAEGGLMSITGSPDGQPVKVGIAVVDLLAGMHAVQGILAALIARQQTGQGQLIDIALMDCQIAALMNVASEHLFTGAQSNRYGNGHPSIVPYQAFPASDGQFVLTVGTDRQFALLCRIIDLPHLSGDERFVTNAARVRNRAALVELLGAVFRTQPVAFWVDRMLGGGLPAGRIRSVGDALSAPEVLERGMVEDVDHPTSGRIRIVGSPLKLSGTPTRTRLPPPLLGQHSEEVVREVLGYDTKGIEALTDAGAIRGRRTTGRASEGA